MRALSTVALVLALGVGIPALPAMATGSTGVENVVHDPAVAGPVRTEQGIWRTGIQQVFDARTRTLTRRLYEVWDPEPSRDLDFVWTPEGAGIARHGRTTGRGHLVWSLKDRPSCHVDAIVAEYRGGMREGRNASQFTLPISAAKSSQHSFRIVLQLADGREISSRPIRLTYYRPSWFDNGEQDPEAGAAAGKPGN